MTTYWNHCIICVLSHVTIKQAPVWYCWAWFPSFDKVIWIILSVLLEFDRRCIIQCHVVEKTLETPKISWRIQIKPRAQYVHGTCHKMRPRPDRAPVHHPPSMRNSRFPVKRRCWFWYSWHTSTKSRTTTRITLTATCFFLAAAAIAIAQLGGVFTHTNERESCLAPPISEFCLSAAPPPPHYNLRSAFLIGKMARD